MSDANGAAAVAAEEKIEQGAEQANASKTEPAMLAGLAGLDAARLNDWMQKVEAENAGQERYAKKQYQMAMISAVCSVLVLLVVIICVLTLLPRVTKTFDQIDQAMTEINIVMEDVEEISGDLAKVDFEGMAKGVDSLVNDSAKGVEEAIGKLNSLDIETLNKSINDLSAIVGPLARLFGK